MQRGDIMTLEQLLQNNPEVLASVNQAITEHNATIEDKTKHVRFVDLSEGGYVSRDRYSNLETKFNDLTTRHSTLETQHNTTKSELNTANNNLTTLQNKYDTDIEAVRKLARDRVVSMAIESGIDSLGITDEVVRAGVRSMVNRDNLSIDDNFVVSGISEQIQTIRDGHSELFNGGAARVNTKPAQQQTNGKRVYNSLDEIAKLSPAEFAADRANILENITKLSKNK